MESLRDVLLVIADISGYTHFMVATAKELSHGQAIITALLEAVLARAELPLLLAKLEGDAAFLYAIREPDGFPPDLGPRLLHFFDAFAEELARIGQAGVCDCTACRTAPQLRLKVVAHAGQALLHRTGGIEELAGVDVIVVHRLLKNSVEAREYLLLTDAAANQLAGLEDLRFERRTERYDELGEVPVRVHLRGEQQREQADRGWGGTSWVRRSLFAARWLATLMRVRAGSRRVPEASM